MCFFWIICNNTINATIQQIFIVVYNNDYFFDIYITAFVDQKEKQSTDTHYRCQTGNGSFNWRIVLDIDVPRINNKLTINAYDKDILSTKITVIHE